MKFSQMSFGRKLLLLLAAVFVVQALVLAGIYAVYVNNKALVHYNLKRAASSFGVPDYLSDSIDRKSNLETIKETSRILEHYPNDVATRVSRAKAYKDLQRWKEALGDYDKLAEQEPSNSKWFEERGNVNEYLCRYDAAIHDYSRAIELAGAETRLLITRAAAYRRAGKREKALEELKSLKTDEKLDYSALSELCDLCCDLGEYERAHSALTRMIALDDSYYSNSGRRTRAGLYLKQGRLAEAAEDYEVLCAAADKDVNCDDLFDLANVYDALGNDKNCQSVRERAVRTLEGRLKEQGQALDKGTESDSYYSFFDAETLLTFLEENKRDSEYETYLPLVMKLSKKNISDDGQDVDRLVGESGSISDLVEKLPEAEAKELATFFLGKIKNADTNGYDKEIRTIRAYAEGNLAPLRDGKVGLANRYCYYEDEKDSGKEITPNEKQCHILHDKADQALDQEDLSKAMKLATDANSLDPEQYCAVDTLLRVSLALKDKVRARKCLEKLEEHGYLPDETSAYEHYQLSLLEGDQKAAQKNLSIAGALGNEKALAELKSRRAKGKAGSTHKKPGP